MLDFKQKEKRPKIKVDCLLPLILESVFCMVSSIT